MIVEEVAWMDTTHEQTYKEKDQRLIHNNENLSGCYCHKTAVSHPLQKKFKIIVEIRQKIKD